MRKLLTTLTAMTFAACGGDATGPEIPTGTPDMAILSGDRQETSVEDTIPFDTEVQLMRDGKPVPNQLADWRVTMDGCGEPFVTTTESDSSGVVKNRAIAGTRAHSLIPDPGFCTMEVRWIDQSTGQAVTDTTVLYWVEPGPIVQVLGPGAAREGNSPLDIGAVAKDQHGNPTNFRADVDSVFTVLDTIYGSAGARTLRAEREGEAVVCIRSPDSLLAVGKGVSYGERMRFEVHGAQDTTNEHSEVQPEDCR